MQRISAHLPAAIRRNLRWAWISLIAVLPGLISAAPSHAAATGVRDTPDLHTSRDASVMRLAVRSVLHAARAHADRALALHTVRAGESISSVAVNACHGQARMWTGIYAASRAAHLTARNANVLRIGQELALNCAYLPAELKYAQSMTPRAVTTAVYTWHKAARHGPFLWGDGDGDGLDLDHPPAGWAQPRSSGHAYRAVTVYRGSRSRSYSSSSYRGSGGCQSHIIADESGGNARAVNPSSGAGGLYQFLPTTWQGLGHSGLAQNASVAEQNQAYHQQVAQSGYSAWAASGGC
jgi:hypothetical protein